MNRNDFNINQRYFQSNRHLPSPSSTQSSFYSPSSRNFNDMQQHRHNFIRKNRSIKHEIVYDDGSGESHIDENWEHYYAHRDRRDLYERILNASPL